MRTLLHEQKKGQHSGQKALRSIGERAADILPTARNAQHQKVCFALTTDEAKIPKYCNSHSFNFRFLGDRCARCAARRAKRIKIAVDVMSAR